jgi:hypothetical protein
MEQIFGDRKGLQSYTMLLILFGLMLVCLYLALSFVRLTLPVFFSISSPDTFINTPADQLRNPLALLYIQAISSSIGFFLLPVLLYRFGDGPVYYTCTPLLDHGHSRDADGICIHAVADTDSRRYTAFGELAFAPLTTA